MGRAHPVRLAWRLGVPRANAGQYERSTPGQSLTLGRCEVSRYERLRAFLARGGHRDVWEEYQREVRERQARYNLPRDLARDQVWLAW